MLYVVRGTGIHNKNICLITREEFDGASEFSFKNGIFGVTISGIRNISV